jgi:lauroyl/myristoyl acyltransferase
MSFLQRLGFAGIYGLGWLLGKGPSFLAGGLCHFLGAVTYRLSDRRHSILSALERAFPEKDAAWREKIARMHCSRMFEMFLLILALPHWSPAKIRRRFRLDPSIEFVRQAAAEGKPVMFAIPHSALMESLTVIPTLDPSLPQIITLYRPLDSAAAEAYVHWAREKGGAQLVARKEGLMKAKNHLASPPSIVGILFDQSAGDLGHLMLFFNRVCSTTNLPGLLAAKAGAKIVFLHTHREGFWKGAIVAKPVEIGTAPKPADIMDALHETLEEHLRSGDEACSNWFWAHKRWKGPQRRAHVLTFQTRKSYLPEQLARRGLATLPQRTRILLRLDARPELLPTARRVLRLLRNQRPDARFWVLAPEELDTGKYGPVEEIIRLPQDAEARIKTLKAVNDRYFDLLFCLDSSRAATQEARLLLVDFAAGVQLPGGPRKVYQVRASTSDAEYLKHPWTTWKHLFTQMGIAPEAIDPAAGVVEKG